jgi:hypothetical protein
MVFMVLLDLADLLKFENFSLAVITTTSFRLVSLFIGPVFNRFMAGNGLIRSNSDARLAI